MKRPLKIRNLNGSPFHWRVWLGEHELTNFLTGLTLTIEAGALPSVELRILVTELDIDAEALAVLEAHVRQQQEDA